MNLQVTSVSKQSEKLSASPSAIQVVTDDDIQLSGTASIPEALRGNATKFVPAGTAPQVRIWSEVREDRRRVFIRDNGIGIKPEDLKRLFRIFERVGDQSLYPGTGVGLSIVRKALEKMNGTVQVESTVGQGSTFSFELKSAPPGQG